MSRGVPEHTTAITMSQLATIRPQAAGAPARGPLVGASITDGEDTSGLPGKVNSNTRDGVALLFNLFLGLVREVMCAVSDDPGTSYNCDVLGGGGASNVRILCLGSTQLRPCACFGWGPKKQCAAA